MVTTPVTLKFRQLGTKVRIGIYETVPGYSVKDVKFYTAADVHALMPPQIVEPMLPSSLPLLTSTPKVPTPSPSPQWMMLLKLTTTRLTSPSLQSLELSQPSLNWGGLNYTIAEEGEKTAGNVFLGRSSNTASFAGDAADNYYVVYLPNEAGTNLNLRVDYTLESIDGGGETIKVRGATAQVPSIYTTWKPGFAYTYLFKISDKTNGRTGVYDPTKPDDTTVNSDPAGLYPITFDAVVENAEDNDATQETITTVSAPSITTYQKGSTVINDNEYHG